MSERGDTITAIDKVAHDSAEILSAAFKRDASVEVKNFTPSVQAGRRYIGLKIDGKEILVTIQVEGFE